MIIYAIISKIDGKIYIGSSINNLNRRWIQGHRAYLNNNTHNNKHLQYAWNKYGPDNFTCSEIEPIKKYDKEYLLEREEFWINKLETYKPSKGYNLIKKPTYSSANCILKEEDVIEIIKLLEEDELTRIDIAEKFNISLSTISQIATGWTWQYLPRNNIKRKKGKKALIDKQFIEDVFSLTKEGKNQYEIAEIKKANQSTICRILKGEEKYKKQCEEVYCVI